MVKWARHADKSDALLYKIDIGQPQFSVAGVVQMFPAMPNHYLVQIWNPTEMKADGAVL